MEAKERVESKVQWSKEKKRIIYEEEENESMKEKRRCEGDKRNIPPSGLSAAVGTAVGQFW